MQKDNKLLEDVSRLAGGLGHALGSAKQEIEARVRERAEVFAQRLDLVPREEFEVLREMVSKLREEQERLKAEIQVLSGKTPGQDHTKAPVRPKAKATKSLKTTSQKD